MFIVTPHALVITNPHTHTHTHRESLYRAKCNYIPLTPSSDSIIFPQLIQTSSSLPFSHPLALDATHIVHLVIQITSHQILSLNSYLSSTATNSAFPFQMALIPSLPFFPASSMLTITSIFKLLKPTMMNKIQQP
jgi:hypothetical protein